jgi:hypothetical protein
MHILLSLTILDYIYKVYINAIYIFKWNIQKYICVYVSMYLYTYEYMYIKINRYKYILTCIRIQIYEHKHECILHL